MPESAVSSEIIKYGLTFFAVLMLFYVTVVLFKNRIVGSRGEFMRVVDVVALTQTSRVALVELAGARLFVLAINNDRIYPVATVEDERLIRRVLHLDQLESAHEPSND